MIPQEQNDRLLELAGECRHEWIEAEHGYRFVCRKCGRDWLCDDPDEPEPPTVGDDIDMTLGEMVRLAEKRWPCVSIVWNSGLNQVTLRWVDKGHRCVFHGAGTCLELALAAAILAAVDGAR